MKNLQNFFVDNSGLIAWVNENGESNYPMILNEIVKPTIVQNKVELYTMDGELHETYVLWDKLSDLVKVIES